MTFPVRGQEKKHRASSKRPTRKRLRSSDKVERVIQPIIDAYQAPVVLLDRTGVIRYVNQAWRRVVRTLRLQSKTDGVGLHYRDLCRETDPKHAVDARAVERKLRRLLTGTSTSFAAPYRLHLAPKRRQRFLLRGSRFKLPGDAPRAWVLLVHENMPTTKSILKARRDRDQRLHGLTESTPLMGHQPDAFYRDPRLWLKCVHEQDRERVEEAYTAWLRGARREYHEQFRVVLPDGSIRWLDDHGARLHDQRGMVGFATRIAKDMTEHKQHEDHLRRLSARLISAQEEERRRIARELHDHVNQTLALLSVELGQLGRVSPSTSAAETLIQAMQQRVTALSSDVHDLSHRLHPAKLKHLGLVPALRALCRDMEEHGLHVCWMDRAVPRTIPDAVALTLYRVAQEGLQNVRKHSGIDAVEVLLTGQPSAVTLRLRDHGKGFDPSLVRCGDGLGLVSMTERVSGVGGTLAIRSAPGAGTEIEASVPLEPGSP